jgi:hypothetical protein
MRSFDKLSLNNNLLVDIAMDESLPRRTQGNIAGAGAPNFLSGAYSVFVVGNLAYVAAAVDNSLTIIDVSVPAAPTFVGNIAGGGAPNFLEEPLSVFVVGNLAYVAAAGDNSLTIIDVTDPAAPTFVGNIAGAGAPNFLNGVYSVFVVGNLAYVAADSDDSLTIIDVTDPAAPTFVGNISGAGAPNFLDRASSVFVVGNLAYVTAQNDNSLTIIDVSVPAAPTFVGNIAGAGAPNFLGSLRFVFVVGNLAYVAANDDNSLTIIDVSVPAAPTFVGNISGSGAPNFLGEPRSVFVVGNLAYVVASDDSSLTIIDVTDPAAPTFVGNIAGGGAPNFLQYLNFVFVVGNLAYVAAYDDNSLTIVGLQPFGKLTHDLAKPHHTFTFSGSPAFWDSIPGIGTPIITFDGVADFLECPAVDSADVNFATEDFTLLAWVNNPLLGGAQLILNQGVVNVDGWEFFLFGSTLSFRLNQAGGHTDISAINALAASTWQLVAVTRSGATGQFYVNGLPIPTLGSGTLADAVSCAGGNKLLVGTQNNEVSNFFDGSIGGGGCGPRIWGRALTAAEIAEVFACERHWFGV